MGSTKQVKQTCSIENKNESWAWVQIGINSGNRFMLAGKFTRNTGNVFIFREMWSGTEWFQQHLLVASLFIYTIWVRNQHLFFFVAGTVSNSDVSTKMTLVGGLEHFLFSIIYGIILPIDFHIFQDGDCSTNQTCFKKLERRGWKTFDYLLSTRFESWKLSANKNLKYYVCTPRIVEMSRHLWLIHFFWIVKPLILGYVPLFF